MSDFCGKKFFLLEVSCEYYELSVERASQQKYQE